LLQCQFWRFANGLYNKMNDFTMHLF
jgi:hypothetical protein